MYDAKGDLYIKAENLKSLVSQLESDYGSYLPKEIATAINTFVSKIDNQWIRISSDDMKTYSDESSQTQKCINNAISDFKKNQTDTKQITDLYQKDPFINMDKKLSEQNGSVGYQLSMNYSNLSSFGIGFVKTNLYKSLASCDKTITTPTEKEITDSVDAMQKAENESKKTATVTHTVWVSTWGHQITKFETKAIGVGDYSKMSADFKFEPQFNENFTIPAPAKYITFTELKSYMDDMSNAINDYYNSYYSSSSYDNTVDYSSSTDSTSVNNLFNLVSPQLFNKL
jgi:hypothetical protein